MKKYYIAYYIYRRGYEFSDSDIGYEIVENEEITESNIEELTNNFKIMLQNKFRHSYSRSIDRVVILSWQELS